MSPLTETVLFVFGLVALGYLAGLDRLSQAADRRWRCPNSPSASPCRCCLFRTMVSADFHGAAPWALWGPISRPSSWPGPPAIWSRRGFSAATAQAGVVGGVSTAFSNLVLLGIPFMLGVFGQEGFDVLSLLVSVHLPTMMMASIIMFELFGRAEAASPRTRCCWSTAFCAQDRRQSADRRHPGRAGLAPHRPAACRAGGCASSMRWPTSPDRWRCLPWGSACAGSAFPATSGWRWRCRC